MQPRRKSYPRVAICVDRVQSYGNRVLKGIARYVETYGPWSLFIDLRFMGDYAQNWLKDWQGDGILAYIEDLRLAKILQNSKVPVVELFGHRFDLGLPQVCPENESVGRLAARHLLERQFKHFTYCGYHNMPWSDSRQKGFVETINAAGYEVEIHQLVRQASTLSVWNRMQQRVSDWISTLPRPNGIMVCSDRHAQRILDACRRANISVPEEIAIIGAGNDEELCRLSDPPLTSVMHDTERVGYEAAKMLGQILAGEAEAKRARTVYVAPVGIVARRSTDVTAIEDRLVANAMRYIREHACEGLRVQQILEEFHVSHSVFYRRFERALSRSPHQEILRVQLERSMNLLTQTDLSIERIAEMAGFTNPEYLYVAFKREIGMTPRQYRKRNEIVQ